MYALILVDYNSMETTVSYVKQCRESLGVRGASHVVIVDNGSRDDSLAILEASFGAFTSRDLEQITQKVYCFEQDGQHICYCRSGDNLGYAGGNNLGAQIAKALWDDKYLIISNNDLVFETKPDLTVVDRIFAQEPQIALIGPRIITPAGEQQSPRFWKTAFQKLFVYQWISMLGIFLGDASKERVMRKYCNDTVYDAPAGVCDWVSGCFFFIRAKDFFCAGMFDTATFLYAEEMILSRRLEKIGKQIWFCPEVEIVHKHAQTTKKAISLINTRQIDFNSNWYYYKTYEHTSPIVLTLAKWNFAIYKALLTLWRRLKTILHRED